jgi:chromosome segregation ATPase
MGGFDRMIALDSFRAMAASKWPLFRRGKVALATLCSMLEEARTDSTLQARLAEQAKAKEAQAILDRDAFAKDASATAALATESARKHLAEISQWQAQSEAQKSQIDTLTSFSSELRHGLDEARTCIKQLQDEKHLAAVELAALKRHFETQRIGNGKLTTLIKRRLRPDGKPERLNSITHAAFRQ